MSRKYLKSFNYFIIVLCSSCFFSACAASSAGANGSASQEMTPFQFIFSTVWFVLMGVFIYFMLVRKPEIEKETIQEKFVSNLKKGMKVVTSGGVIAEVLEMKESYVVLNTGGSELRVLIKNVSQLPEGIKVDLQDSSEKKSKKKS